MPTGSFTVILGRAYFNRNFFNVPLSYSNNFESHNSAIDIFLGHTEMKILGRIDRKSNPNGTPRIHGRGGLKLKKWIQETFREGNVMNVSILSKTSIRLLK
jgi:hypothetical protein